MWLEFFDPEKDTLSFKFALRTVTNHDVSLTNREIIVKSLVLKPSELWKTHTRFVNYFNKYATDTSLNNDNGGELLNINLSNDTANISGIDVQNGVNVKTRQINNLVADLCSTERLLLDFDNLILKNFKHQCIIARQLINFNFIFDADEFITPNILNMMYGAGFEMDVHVEINGQELPMKDFYTNYEFIPRKPIGYAAKNIPENESKKLDIPSNIFDLIKDHKNVNLICKNKISQNVFHWALDGNPQYIFNLYTGFGGYSLDEQHQVSISPYNYQDSPDIWVENYARDSGNIDWCYPVVIKDGKEAMEFALNPSYYLDKSIIGQRWCSNIRFNKTMEYSAPLVLVISENAQNFEEILYAISPEAQVIKMPNEYRRYLNNDEDKPYNNLLNNIGVYEFGPKSGLKCIVCNENQLDAMTFANFRKNLSSFIRDIKRAEDIAKSKHSTIYDMVNGYMDDPTSTFQNGLGWIANGDYEFAEWLNSVDEPQTVSMKLLGYISANGPVKENEELEHIKVQESVGKIFRYDGKIKPCFIDANSNYFNYLYFKKVLLKSQVQTSEFARYANTGYSPNYPDLNYYPYDRYKIEHINDRDIRLADDDTVVDVDALMPYEYKLYNTSKVLLLHNSMDFELTIDTKTQDIYNEIYNYIKKAYDVIDDRAKYIYNQYNIKFDWEYTHLDNTHIYTYKIKLTLK